MIELRKFFQKVKYYYTAATCRQHLSDKLFGRYRCFNSADYSRSLAGSGQALSHSNLVATLESLLKVLGIYDVQSPEGK